MLNGSTFGPSRMKHRLGCTGENWVPGIPAVVQGTRLEGGLVGEFMIVVPTSLAHRARWIATQLPMSDAGLGYLATGDLSGDKL